ncbi:MAG: HAMP domain-containing protein [bacterium]|nr:HAMP domain-containing protein [bacterium]
MNFFRKLSIRNKLIVIILLAAMMAIAVGFTFVLINDIATFKDDMINQTIMNAKLIGEYSVSPLTFEDKPGGEETLKKLQSINAIHNGFLYDTQGAEFASYTRPGEKESPAPPPFGTSKKLPYKFKGKYLYVAQPIKYHKNDYGTIYLVASTNQLDSKINRHLLSMFIVIIILLILSYFTASRLQRVISRPILKLAGVTEKISREGDYSLRVEKKGDDEIGVLYEGFNNMLGMILKREQERDKAEAEREEINIQLAEKNNDLGRVLKELEERNKDLGRVLYVTSHDLRSPLVNIEGWSKRLGKDCERIKATLSADTVPAPLREELEETLDENIPMAIDFIDTSVAKMSNLLKGVLQLSRTGRAELTIEPLDMNKMISDIQATFDIQLNGSNIQLTVDQQFPCMGDENQINQVFSNLLGNAIKYSKPDEDSTIKICCREEENMVVYSFEDNGIGIAQQHQEKVFNIFEQVNPEAPGDGMGLAIVNKIIERHNGKIWVESEEGVGSTFYVSLPGVQEK